MKKLMIIILLACFVPIYAFAVDITEFNINAMTLGEEAIDESTGSTSGSITSYSAGNCKFGFFEENNEITRIIVLGEGISFLSYSMAAIMTFDDTANITNAGNLLIAFMLARNGEMQYGTVSTGESFLINPQDEGYYFTIGK